jgi:hypothetical protein
MHGPHNIKFVRHCLPIIYEDISLKALTVSLEQKKHNIMKSMAFCGK